MGNTPNQEESIAPKHELGHLLKTMALRLRAKKRWSMLETEAYLAMHAGVRIDAVRAWLGGRNQPNDDALEVLIAVGVTEVEMEKAWAEQVLYLTRHHNREMLLKRLYPPQGTHIRHNLPPRPYLYLVGRTEELETIRDRLAPESRHWNTVIEGIGGNGKTALALEAAWRCVEDFDALAPSRRFDYVIWVSAKRAEMTTRGIHPVRPTLTTIHDLYRTIANVLEYDEILRIRREDQRVVVERALREAGRTLLVLDNLETLEDPAELMDFLKNLPPPTKAIVTMRPHEDMPYPIRLRELDEEASLRMMQQVCEARGIALRQEEAERFLRAIGGLPLAIWLAIGMMDMHGYTVEKTLAILTGITGDLLTYIFGAQMAHLRAEDPEAYAALLVLSFFDVDVGASHEAIRV